MCGCSDPFVNRIRSRSPSRQQASAPGCARCRSTPGTDPRGDLDLLVGADDVPLAQQPAARQPPRAAVVEVAQDLGRVEAICAMVDRRSARKVGPAVPVPLAWIGTPPCAVGRPPPAPAPGARRRRGRRAGPGAGWSRAAGRASARRRRRRRAACGWPCPSSPLFRSAITKILTNQKPACNRLSESVRDGDRDLDRARRPVPGDPEGAGLLRRPERRVLDVGGAEAGVSPGPADQRRRGTRRGRGCCSALLDRKGRMRGDMRVLRLADGFGIGTEEVAAPPSLRHLEMYKIGRDVSLVDRSSELAVISVIGPGAAEIVLAGPAGSEHSHREVRLGELQHAPSPPTSASTWWSRREGVGCARRARGRRRRAGERGGGGDRSRRERAPAIRSRDDHRDDPRGGRDQRARGQLHQGCYIGQETVARLHYKGKPNRSLRGLRLSAPAAAGDPIRLGERELGQVGTAVLSPLAARSRSRSSAGRPSREQRSRSATGSTPRSSSCRSEARTSARRPGFG